MIEMTRSQLSLFYIAITLTTLFGLWAYEVWRKRARS